MLQHSKKKKDIPSQTTRNMGLCSEMYLISYTQIPLNMAELPLSLSRQSESGTQC